MIRIFLIGYMGAGKTTLGKAFARDMNIPFIDLDWYIEERYHKTVRQIFEELGENNFRKIERKMLREVAEFENVIIATGGGTPCFFDNMDYMNACGETVFLDANTKVLFRRLKMAKYQRPLLAQKTDEELNELIHQALEERLPFYQKAKYIFCGDKLENRHQIQESVESLKQMLNYERKVDRN